MKLTVIFNTCGISGHENVERYISSIHSILNQNFNDFRVVLSSCQNSKAVRDRLMSEFKNRISYSFIDDVLPVNITFNKSVQSSVSNLGKSDGYLYIDSGIDMSDDLEALSKLYDLHKSGPNGMTASRVDCDAGYWLWFGQGVPGWDPHVSPTPQQDFECSQAMFRDGSFTVPIGKTVNLHLQIFDNSIFESFDGRLMPDIFASHSTEGVFSFINSCLNKKFVVHKDVFVRHLTAMDGGSSGFRPERAGVQGYRHTISFSKKTIMDVVDSQEAKNCGFGYEECQSILMHDKLKFDECGFSMDPERLKKFLLEGFYLSKEEFDYENINHVFLK
jgi:hypothetical protein